MKKSISNTPRKKTYYENTGGGAHENCCIKRPSHLQWEHSKSLSFFLLVNALVYNDIDQGIH